MKNNPRGFEYELESLRIKSEWELQSLQQYLSRLNDQVGEQEQQVEQRQTRLAQIVSEHLLQQERLQIIHVDRQVIAYDYISELSEHVKHADEVLSRLEGERDKAVDQVNQLQKYCDGLEVHREKELKNYLQSVSKSDLVESDDAWLRSAYWRTAQ